MDEVPEHVEALQRLLDRRTSLLSLEALQVATLAPDGRGPVTQSEIAIGFDTVAALRLTDRKRTEVVDYLIGRHAGPVVLPGQVIQEFWKNSLAEIQTIGASLLGKYQSVADQVRKANIDTGEFPERFDQLVTEFAAAYSLTYDPNTEQRIAAVLDALQKRAIVPYVPRTSFRHIAEIRERTKTPPGFKDVGYGDFYVWADFLYGLQLLRSQGLRFDLAVLVTDDTKIDWSRGGQAHPILVAEVRALLDVPFQTWTLGRLDDFVAARLAASVT